MWCVVILVILVICQNRFSLVKIRHYIINILYLYIVSQMTHPKFILTILTLTTLTTFLRRQKHTKLVDNDKLSVPNQSRESRLWFVLFIHMIMQSLASITTPKRLCNVKIQRILS